MKRITVLIVVTGMAALFAAGCTKNAYESQKTAGDVTLSLAAASYPLVKGDNALTLKLTDGAGKPVTDAQVAVRVSMPPMPGMAPMDFNPQALLKGDAYAVTANTPMEGGWKVEVSVTRPGKPASTATFNLDAR